jgi:hypothetical protein
MRLRPPSIARYPGAAGEDGEYGRGGPHTLSKAAHSDVRVGLIGVTSDPVEPVAGPAMSASLIGRSGSSTFRLSAAAVSMSLTGSRFFSNRPFRVKHFQTIRRCSVDVAHGLALLFGIGAKALPLWDSRMRWSNLCSGLAVRRNGRSKRTCELTSSIVPRGTSSTARWSSSFLLLDLIL